MEKRIGHGLNARNMCIWPIFSTFLIHPKVLHLNKGYPDVHIIYVTCCFEYYPQHANIISLTNVFERLNIYANTHLCSSAVKRLRFIHYPAACDGGNDCLLIYPQCFAAESSVERVASSAGITNRETGSVIL